MQNQDSITYKYRQERNMRKKWKTYLVYQCSPSSELRGQNNRADNCYKHSVRASKFSDDELRLSVNDLQMKCPHCGAKPRKNYGNITVFETRMEAMLYAKMLNEEGSQ